MGKKKAYDLLKQFPEAQRVLESIFLKTFQNLTEGDDKFKVIVQFVIWCYRKTSICKDINVFRGEVYTQNCNVETIPPTTDALLLHTKRAIYQAGVWARSLQHRQELPSPSRFGWKQSSDFDRKWEPVWMLQKSASKEIREFFIVCKCSGVCKATSRCMCKGSSMPCTSLCKCKCLLADKIIYTEPEAQRDD